MDETQTTIPVPEGDMAAPSEIVPEADTPTPTKKDKRSETSKKNGASGGRPKGSRARHTIQAATAQKQLIEMALKEMAPVWQKLIEKAREGDMAAIKELNSRVLGLVTQPLEHSGEIRNPVELNDEQFAKLIREGTEKLGS